MINKFNQLVNHPDLGKLILRVTIGVLMLLHGLHKMEPGGLAGIQGMLANINLPSFIAYGTLIGEVLCPILLIIGLFTRASAFIVAITMLVAILMVHSSSFWALDPKTGGWAAESAGIYLLAGLALMFLGSGRFAIRKD
ncbi:DoxX family protein [Proteus myxofaciens]|uniref:Putative membrane protein n=1 Tax=Proteus myxofaciens ATCC 19692 TaxID=1354337 RepID=A0A198FNX3_9GAMM|nr:DoxX family protein [Proteus myxofaciens]OAT26164.1 putative membrane protein [Proteus myxofaciens ATCC 19692]